MATSKAWLSFNLYLGYVVQQENDEHTFQKCGNACNILGCPFKKFADFIVAGSFHTVRRRRPFQLSHTRGNAAIFDAVWSIGTQVEIFQPLASPVTALEMQMFLDCTGENSCADHLFAEDSITRQFNLPLMLYFLQKRKGTRDFECSNKMFGTPVFEALIAALWERENYPYIRLGVREKKSSSYIYSSKDCHKEWVDFLRPKDYGKNGALPPCLGYGVDSLRGMVRKKDSGVYKTKQCKNFDTCQKICWLGGEIQSDKTLQCFFCSTDEKTERPSAYQPTFASPAGFSTAHTDHTERALGVFHDPSPAITLKLSPTTYRG